MDESNEFKEPDFSKGLEGNTANLEAIAKAASNKVKQAAKEREGDGFNWDEFESIAQIPYKELWDESREYHENVALLLGRAIALPNPDVLLPIVTAYTCLHSVTCRFIPVLTFQGKTGTGKSQAQKCVAALRGELKGMISQTTFASLRNYINQNRWYSWDKEIPNTSRNNERPYMLHWVDQKESSFADPNTYGLFRVGCDRSEDRLTIAAEDGKNQEFFVFGAKTFSTIEDFYTREKWSELLRRLLVVKCISTDELSPDDLKNWNPDIAINPDTVEWDGIRNRFNDHWNRDRLLHAAHLQRQYGNMKKQFLTKGGSEKQFRASFDLMVCMIASNFFPDVKDGKTKPSTVIDLFLEYWKYFDDVVVRGRNALHEVCEAIINDLLGSYYVQLEAMKEMGVNVNQPRYAPKIEASLFKSRFDQALANGVIVSRSPRDIIESMGDLGWSQRTIGGSHFWMPKE